MIVYIVNKYYVIKNIDTNTIEKYLQFKPNL